MTSTFEKCKPAIVAAEGGDNHDNPDDRGGRTRLGVSQREYPHLDVSKMNDEQLFLILEQDYWKRYRLAKIQDQTIANQAMLLFINMNPNIAARIIQKAVNVVANGMMILNTDGVLGSISFKAINYMPAQALSDRVRVEAVAYYLHLTDINPRHIPNFRSWIRRSLI